jgi:hypothetical protein
MDVSKRRFTRGTYPMSIAPRERLVLLRACSNRTYSRAAESPIESPME